MRPQRAALKDLEATKRYIPDDLEIYFDDINDASERIWDMLENYKEVVEALESTNESVLSHRLNDTFRVLTAISVIVLPLTLIASIWGMNTKVPGEGSHAGFFAVVGVMVVVLVGDDRALQAPRLALSARHGAPRRAAGLAGRRAGGAPRCLVQAAAGRNGAAWARTRRQAGGAVAVEEGASLSRLEGCDQDADRSAVAPMRLAGVPGVRVTRPSS